MTGGGAGLLVLGVVVGATLAPVGPLGEPGVVAPVGRRHTCREVATGGRVFAVRRVIDGDTFVVEDYDGEPTAVRIIGIDTPERGELGYGEARDALAAILGESGMLVELRFDPEDAGGGGRGKRDAFGRLLCRVTATDRQGGRLDVGDRLLALGHAVPYREGGERGGDEGGRANEHSTLPAGASGGVGSSR